MPPAKTGQRITKFHEGGGLMGDFQLVSEFKATGDQPEAIEKLVWGAENGLREQVLLGVTR